MEVQEKVDQVVVADVAAVEAVDVERRKEEDGEGLSPPTSLLAVPVAPLLEERLAHVLPPAVVAVVVEGALVHGDQGGQGEGESHLPLHHDDQMVHEEESHHHAFQTRQEA